MNVQQQLTQYRADLAKAKKELVAVQVFDRTVLRASRIAERADYIQTLEVLIRLCEADDAQIVEDMAMA